MSAGAASGRADKGRGGTPGRADTVPDGVVELRSGPRMVSRASVRRSWIFLLLSGLGVLAVVVGVVTVMVSVAVTRGLPPGWQTASEFWSGVVAIAVLGLFGTTSLLQALSRRSGLAISSGDPLEVTAPHAFSLIEGQLRFPAYFRRDAEVWPLNGTSVDRSSLLGVIPVLRLRHEGRATRWFFASVLKDPVEVVIRRVEAQRR